MQKKKKIETISIGNYFIRFYVYSLISEYGKILNLLSFYQGIW
jgi:hypothetical protein